MATRALGSLVQLLRQFRLHRGGTTTDAELLQLFISQRDEDAFETLVQRHGPMVLGVCRRILHNEADVEDCFQATFLVLVRKAAALRRRGLVGNWLYGAARKAALKARAMKNLRHRKEREAAAEKVRTAVDHDRDLQELLDQELERLPDKYRSAIVLCDLEGMTVAAAAKQVGCPQGTLNARLVRGRAMLAKRLARHGLAVSGGVLATALCQNAASACLPGPLLVSTVEAATLLAAGKALATGAISAKVVALTEGVLKAMLMTKLKVALAVVLAVQLIGAGVGLVYCQTAGSGQPGKGQAVTAQTRDRAVVAHQQPAPKADGKDGEKKDGDADPRDDKPSDKQKEQPPGKPQEPAQESKGLSEPFVAWADGREVEIRFHLDKIKAIGLNLQLLSGVKSMRFVKGDKTWTREFGADKRDSKVGPSEVIPGIKVDLRTIANLKFRPLQAPPFTWKIIDGREAIITPNSEKIAASGVTGEFFQQNVFDHLASPLVGDPAKLIVLGEPLSSTFALFDRGSNFRKPPV